MSDSPVEKVSSEAHTSFLGAGACGGVVQPHRGLSALMEVTGLSQPLLVVCVDRCTAGLKSLL
jgi:hypothetical protein